MKITQRSLHTNAGSITKCTKASKKSKGAKKPAEKFLKDLNSSDSQEKITKLKSLKPSEKKQKVEKSKHHKVAPLILTPTSPSQLAAVVDKKLLIAGGEAPDVKNDLKKRKQEGNEWKALRKIDYQRLETVVEEGQLSSEESSSKPNCLEEPNRTGSDHSTIDITRIRSKRTKMQNLSSIAEQPETRKIEEEQRKLEQQQQQQPYQNNDKCFFDIRPDFVENEVSRGEPFESLSKDSIERISYPKRNMNINGMMEILPIFSNDKFVCSRDAISIEEYEDLESLDKNLSHSGKTLVVETQKGVKSSASGLRSVHDSSKLNVKPFISAKSVKTEEPPPQKFDERIVEKTDKSRESTERKLRHKMLTERNLVQKTSSHFINSLLVMTPFATDQESILQEELVKQEVFNLEKDTVTKEDFSSQVQVVEEFPCELKTLPVVVFTTLGLFSICLGFAWKSYEPPCMIDYILEFIPFLHRRRTFIQLFFDGLLKVLSNICGKTCKNYFFLCFSCISSLEASSEVYYLVSFCFFFH